MKFLHVTYHFEYSDAVEEILDENHIEDYVRYSMMEGKDMEGKHFGTQVHPGNVSVVQAQVPDDTVEILMSDLREFREERESHEHLEALIMPVETRL